MEAALIGTSPETDCAPRRNCRCCSAERFACRSDVAEMSERHASIWPSAVPLRQHQTLALLQKLDLWHPGLGGHVDLQDSAKCRAEAALGLGRGRPRDP